MRKIALSRGTFAISILGSCVLGVVLGGIVGLDVGRTEGASVGHAEAKRDSERLIVTMMTAGVKVRKPDGSEAQYVLRPIEPASTHNPAAGAGGAVKR